MAYFLCILSDGTTSIWEVERRHARKLSGGTYLSQFDAPSGQTVWDVMRAQASAWFEPPGFQPFHRIELGPGQFYPFIARPDAGGPADHSWCPSEHLAPDVLARSHGQLIALTRQLGEICQTAHPTRENFKVFGHEIRNLLILACTEVEAHWATVMRANGVTKHNLTRKDYHRLATPMGLRDFAVSFPRYPWMPSIRPFAGWGVRGRLRWYEAYNSAKHDREAAFHEATLLHAITAVVACAVMVEAQFGTHRALLHGSELRTFFAFERRPSWTPAKSYLPPHGRGWSAINEPALRR